MIRITLHCDVCAAVSAPVEVESIEMNLRLPPGWASVVVTLPEQVLPESLRPVADAVQDSSMAPGAFDVMAAHVASMAQPFSTHVTLCNDCLTGPLWKVVGDRFQAASERANEQNAARTIPFESLPGGVASERPTCSHPTACWERDATHSSREVVGCGVCGKALLSTDVPGREIELSRFRNGLPVEPA